MKIDLRFVGIQYELWALGHFLGLVEPQIKYLRDQDRLATFDELRKNGWDNDEAEVDLAFQELHEREQYVIPRFMRGPFIVALWACFESGILEITGKSPEKVRADLRLNKYGNGSFLKKIKKYFESELGLPLDSDKKRYDRLCDLLLIRNALAHANGQRFAMTTSQWDDLTRVLTRLGTPPDELRGVIVLSERYLNAAYKDVEGCLRELMDPVRTIPSLHQVYRIP